MVEIWKSWKLILRQRNVKNLCPSTLEIKSTLNKAIEMTGKWILTTKMLPIADLPNCHHLMPRQKISGDSKAIRINFEKSQFLVNHLRSQLAWRKLVLEIHQCQVASKQDAVTFSMSFGYYRRKLKGAKEVMNCILVSFSSRHSSIIELRLYNHYKAGRPERSCLMLQGSQNWQQTFLIFDPWYT